ncbi:hypothetical protein GGTG_01258 [Gaeumannomyces tritici R3-111a-1]|uniref:Uncharacterized protein n=1 Tax=Gaeumannomyces tritici (strain R3-111a-1) TaxID=644352 RepID=J3NJ24_GAET3|nr:hypothetical protein GGTG_01258 [Gaeumannomyces tritici R3-111a-1]EJT81274.1 hypothetical protein GGTG_01258 [Gaeumannomyces tritici R3-111a-1]
MIASAILAASVLAGLASAAPTAALWPRADGSTPPAGYTGPKAADLIEGTMPDSKTCDLAKFPQCTTAADAAPYFIEAMSTYKIYDYWEIAAVVSLTAMESASLKYKQPASPSSDKGKGTSNMQSGAFNLKFAKSIPELASRVSEITGGSETPTDAQKSEVLKLVQANDYNFRSGAWFLATECSADIRQGLVAGTKQGWLNYVTTCVGVPKGTDEASVREWTKREQYWTDAMTAFGLKYTS